MSSTITPNMGLIVPGIGNEEGPTWGTDLNASLGILDQHNHSPGQGVQITPTGININADLSINSNNLTFVKTLNFQAQLASLPGLAPNLGCIYVAGNELYYNDEAGNVVPITNNGTVNAGAGSITGLPSGTASATYNSGNATFIWQSATSTPANMDGGSFIFREVAANAKGITVSSPSSLPADLSLTLPSSLPATTSIVTLDPSGSLSTFPASPPATTSYVTVSSSGVLALGTSTGTNYVASNSSGAFSTASTSAVPITNMSVTITTTGNPVMIGFKSDGLGSTAYMGLQSTFNAFVRAFYKIQKNASDIYLYEHETFDNGETSVFRLMPPAPLNTVDDTVVGAPGTYTYTLQVAQLGSVGNTVLFNNVVMYAYELK